ncbi:quinone oxidoreductase family protein [Sphingomonas qomolangmaensis]|uniref:Quinone oxidoreductase n=1 Tax=Sphingomonas qomolangmaensis TaxID=2918765 RepID=A0ABY5L3S8_9SPHN|nr:quinone oxidoreductase [Sphingomonas qomolangmaensis]UUL81447.1 quinone oxidoreductase [Sphingomonas qomolangmaensis]
MSAAWVQRLAATGGPDAFEWTQVGLPPPAVGEVRLRATAIGLNYIDTYHRGGLYPVEFPAVLGAEGAGVIEALGGGVEGFAIGDRVGTFSPARGAYATARNVAVDQLVRLPDDIADTNAAALMLKGATAWFLIEQCAKVQAGQAVLVHAAAGGVGLLLVGWLKAIGATVIGVVGSEAKADQARQAGADHVVLHRSEDIAARVRAITDGAGVPVVFDGVGKATWAASLDSAARRGLIVSYGNASGAVDGVNLGVLAAKGSLFVTRPTLFDYATTQHARQQAADRVFAMLRDGAIAAHIGQSFALADVAQAHRAIEAGETTGSTVLLP